MGVAERYKQRNAKKSTHIGVAERYAQKNIGNVITSRVNTWIENNNNYIYNFNTRYSAGNSDYRDDSETWLSTITEQKERFDREAQNIKSLLNQYQDSLGADYVSSVIKALDDNRAQQEKIVSMSAADRDFWANFDSAESYQAYTAQREAHDAMMNYDLESAKTELDTLSKNAERVRELTPQLEALQAQKDKLFLARPHVTDDPLLSHYNQQIDNITAELGQLGSAEDIEKMRAEKEKYYNQARFAQAKTSLENEAKSDADFEEYSSQGAAIENPSYRGAQGPITFAGNPLFGKDIGNIVTFSRDNYADVVMNNSEIGKSIYQQMTDDEVNTYNYYLAKYGEEKANGYLDAIEATLNQREAEKRFDGIKEKPGIEILMGVSSGFDQFRQGIKNLGADGTEYIAPSSTQYLSGMVREDLADVGDGMKLFGNSLGQTAYDIVTTTSNMLPSILTSTAVGFLSPAAGYAVGSVMLGASAKGNAYAEMINLGYNETQAQNYSSLVGASEAGLQLVMGGISKLGGAVSGHVISKVLNNIDNAFARVAITLGGNMLSEGGEEYLQEILDPFFRNIALGENNDVKLFSADALYAGLLGAITAGMLEGGGTVKAEVQTYRQGKQIKDAKTAERLAEVGKTFSADTVAHRLAGKINEKTGAYTIGRLLNEVNATLTEQNQADIARSLEDKGVDSGSARIMAEWLGAAVDGAQLTTWQKKILNENNVLSQTFKEFVDVNSSVSQRKLGVADVDFNTSINEDLKKKEKAAKKNKTSITNAESDAEQAGNTAQTNSPTPAETPDTEAISQPADGKTVRKDTGEEIAIQEIASAKDGEVVLRLEGGETVNVKNVEFGSDDEAVMYEIAGEMNAAVANAMIHGYKADAGLSMVDYARGFHEAYTYGYYGYPMAEMSQEGFSVDLSDEMKTYAYQLGRSSRDARIAEKKNKMASSDHENPVSDNKNAGLHLEFDKNDVALTEREEVSLSALEILSKALGVNIYVYESKTGKNGKHIGANGYYDADGIHIDLYAGQNGNGTMLFTAAHELTHFIREWSPDKFKIFADFLFEQYGKKDVSVSALVARQKEKAATNGRVLDTDAAYEEVVADACETMLTDSDAIEKIRTLYEKDKTLFEKIKAFFAELIAKIKKAYNGLNPDSLEASLVRDMEETAEELHRLWTDALLDAAEQNTASQDSNVKYSIRESFYDEYDAWDKKDTNKVFTVGRTSDALLSIGMKDQNIILRSGTVLQKINKHKELSFDTFKKIPELLEHPVIVQFSDAIDQETKKPKYESRITVLGELYADGKPILVSLELLPTNQKKTSILDFSVIVSAYAKNAVQRYLNENSILYIEPDKKRTNSWLSLNRLQLPLGENRYGSIRRITYSDGKVKIQNKKNMTATERALRDAGVIDDYGNVIQENDSVEVKFSDRDFSAQVDAVLGGADTNSTHLKVMDTPKILQEAGLPDLPILLTAKHLKTITASSGKDRANYHGLDVDIVKKLPEYLADPVMIADSLTREDSVVIITEAMDSEQRPVIAAILLEGEGRLDNARISANIMTSAYGKDNFESFVSRITDKNAVLYWNEKKSQDLSLRLGIQFPNELTSLRSNTIIRKSVAFVNKNEKKTSDRDSDGIGFSNRSLLANALESVAQNDVEKETLAKYKSKIAEMEAQEAKLFEIRERIKNLYADVKSSQDLTFKFDSKKELTNLRIEAQKIVNRLNIYDRQLLELEASKTLKDLLARERGAAYSQAKKKTNERRNKTMMKEKIRGVLRNLDKLSLNPTKEHHVPNGLRKPVAEALTLINRELAQAADDTIANAKKRIQLYDWRLDNYEKYAESTQNPLTKEELTTLRDNAMTRAEKRKLKIDSMLDAYNELKNSSDPILRGAFDENVVSLIEQVKQDVGDKALGDMSLKQLEDVYQMYRAIQKNIRDANKAFKTQRNETISSLADKTIRELSAYDKKEYVLKALEALKKVGWDMLKPEYAMRLIGSDTLLSLWHEVRAGEDVWATDVNEAKAFVEKQKKSHHYDEWDLKTKHEFSTQSGKRFVLAVPQMMSLYAYSKRAQADEHLKLGGFVFDEAIEVTEKKHGIPIKYKVNTAYAHTISKDTIAEITAALSKDQRDFVDEMQEYLSSVMGEKGNEVTRALYDIDLFKEKFYFPLKSAEQFLYEQNTPVGEQKIKNFGFTKKTIQNANNPIILSNFMDVWAGHVIDMSMYHAFTLPLEDFNRVFNYNTPVGKGQDTESVKSHIQTVFGAQAVGYVKTLLTDLNGGARTDDRVGSYNKAISLSKKAAVTASLSVAIQQPSAVMRAMALVAPQHFIGLPKLIPKKTWSEIKKYAPVAIIKEMGGFDTGMGKSTVDWLIGEKTLMDRIDDITGFLPSYADEVTWCNIWIAVKKEIRASKKYAENSEEFMQAAGKRFTEVITRTQVYDSVLSRSGLMRSRDTGAKMLTMFMAEPTVTMNMTVDALIQGKRGKSAAIGMVLRTLSACTAANIVNSVLVSLIYAARDDDEDETYLEKYLASLTSELIDSFNPLTYLPIVRDIWSIMQGYDIERSDMSLISDVWGAVENLWSDKKSVSEKIMGVVGTLSAFLGLPVKNIERDVKAVLNSFTSLKGTTKAGVSKAISEAAKDAIPLLGRFSEDKSRTTMLYEAYLDGDKAQIARMEYVYKNDADAIASALRTGLRENEPRVLQAAEAELRGNPRERVSIVREIIGEGHFSQDIVVTAVTAEAESVKSIIRKAAEAKLAGKTAEHDKLLGTLLEKYPKDLIEKLAGERLDALAKEGAEEKQEETLSFYKNSDINAAFDGGDYTLAGEIIADLIQTKMANGKDEKEARSSVKSAMTSYWKPLYKNAKENGDAEEMARIREILRESDLYGNSNDIRKTVNRWLEDEEN